MKIKAKKIGINGEGIGYLNHKPVFVPGLYLNEVAEIEIVQEYDKYLDAKIKKKITTNPVHKAYYCTNAKCEGCCYKNLNYDQQLKCKIQLLKDTINKYNYHLNYKLKNIRKSDQIIGYRNALKLPFYMKNNQLKLGMYLNNSNHIINADDCSTHDPLLEKAKKEVLKVLNQYHYQSYDKKTKKGLRYLIMRILDNHIQISIISGNNLIDRKTIAAITQIPMIESVYQVINTKKQIINLFSAKLNLLYGDQYLNFNFKNLALKIQPASFFQLNTNQALNLYEYVASLVQGANLVVEGYCGIGLISMFISNQITKGIGIEIIPSAIEDAKMNAQNNHIDNLTFICNDFEKAIVDIDKETTIDYLIIDPPRTGLSKQTMNLINQLNIKTIIYISCNPSTLSKNINYLNYHYELKHIKPFDMFPLTQHVESVALLVQKEKRS